MLGSKASVELGLGEAGCERTGDPVGTSHVKKGLLLCTTPVAPHLGVLRNPSPPPALGCTSTLAQGFRLWIYRVFIACRRHEWTIPVENHVREGTCSIKCWY